MRSGSADKHDVFRQSRKRLYRTRPSIPLWNLSWIKITRARHRVTDKVREAMMRRFEEPQWPVRPVRCARCRPEKLTRKGSSQQFNNPLRVSGNRLHLLLGHRLPRLSEVGQGLLLQT